MKPWVVYVRRSYRTSGDPDVSDEAQVEAAVAMLPAGASHEVLADSGGHHSGRSDDRDAFRELVTRVERGAVAGVAVYDLSRLARNTELILKLHRAMERTGIPLLIAAMPGTRFDNATGRFMLAGLAAAAQLQADMDSERARSIHRSLFEDGRHRGLPPYGYRNGRDDARRRTLDVVDAEADVVRRIFAELASRSLTEVADGLVRDAIAPPSPAGWSRYAVREIYRRAKLYLGLVVARRGIDERPGRHQPILTPELHRGALVGMVARDRGGRRAGPGRTYLLTGVLECDCGRGMTGLQASSRKHRYYACRYCRRPMIRAERLETIVLDAIAAYRLPARSVAAAREELQRRLAGPRDDVVGRQRRRLETRLANLRKQHGWGDIDDATYRRERAETEAMLGSLPSGDKLVAFDRYRAVVLDLEETIRELQPPELKRLVAALVERVTTDGAITWTPPIRPFYALGGVVSMVSPGGRDTPADTTEDPLEYFVG